MDVILAHLVRLPKVQYLNSQMLAITYDYLTNNETARMTPRWSNSRWETTNPDDVALQHLMKLTKSKKKSDNTEISLKKMSVSLLIYVSIVTSVSAEGIIEALVIS